MDGHSVKERLLPPGEEEEEKKKQLWVVAGLAIFTRLATFGVPVISQAFMGHIGPTELAAYALVFTVVARFANGILLGMSSAIETLCGQSYGVGKYHMLGIYMQRSWLVLLPCTTLLLPLFLFTAPTLRLFGQDPLVASMASIISLWFIPAIYSYSMPFALQMYLQSQSKNQVITYWVVLSLCLHIFLSWLTVTKLQLGITGVMGSTVVALWIPITWQVLFVFCDGCPETWKGLSTLAFRDLSSGVTSCMELWYNTILVLLTAHMKDAEVVIDTLSICINISGWELMIAVGFMAATGVRVANEVGAGSPKSGKSVYVAVATLLSTGIVLFLAFLLLRGEVGCIFTESPKAVREVAELSPLLALNILQNSIQPVLSGATVGAGWQGVIRYVNITCYYLVGIPLGVVLGYVVGFGVKGIWMGMIFGVAVQTAGQIWFTCKTDWDKQVAIAEAVLREWSLPKPEGPRPSSEVV